VNTFICCIFHTIPAQSDFLAQNDWAQDSHDDHTQRVESGHKDWTSFLHHDPLYVICYPRAHDSLQKNSLMSYSAIQLANSYTYEMVNVCLHLYHTYSYWINSREESCIPSDDPWLHTAFHDKSNCSTLHSTQGAYQGGQGELCRVWSQRISLLKLKWDRHDIFINNNFLYSIWR